MSDTGKTITHGMLDMMINNREMRAIMNKSLPAALSMQLAKLVRKCSDELVEYSEKKQEIIQRYAKKGEDGKPILQPNDMVTIDPKDSPAAQRELNEIADVPVSEGFELPKVRFNSESMPNMTPQEALVLLPFAKD